MIRRQLRKIGFWLFTLCLIGFMATNHRLNTLEESRKERLAAAEKIFMPVPDSTGINRISIENDSESGINMLRLTVLPNSQQLEYQPQLSNVSFTFTRKQDLLIIKPLLTKRNNPNLRFEYTVVGLRLPPHLESVTLKNIQTQISFAKESTLNKIEIVSVGSDIEITNLNTRALILRDLKSTDIDEKQSNTIEFSDIDAIGHMDVQLSHTYLSMRNLDSNQIGSLILDLRENASLDAKADTLKKTTWIHSP